MDKAEKYAVFSSTGQTAEVGRGTASGRILIVDDDQATLDILKQELEHEGFTVGTALNGEIALEVAAKFRPELVILDVMMPSPDGFEVCRRLRQDFPEQMILFLTSRRDEEDKLMGFEVGGDDYLTKPVSLLELIARSKALLRRMEISPRQDIYSFGDIVCDVVRRKVTKGGENLIITTKEFELLYYLMQHAGEEISRERLLEDVWAYEAFRETRTVDNHISRLRKKLEADPTNPRYFRSVRGVGYTFEFNQ